MNKSELKRLEKNNLIKVYNRLPLTPKEGKGANLIDQNGEKYIDCVAGIAVASLGHSHPRVVKALKKQIEDFMHCSNLYHIEKQARLGKKLSEISCLDKAFFCNSGSEAVESAIKLARKSSEGTKILAAENSFHGRTLGALSATWKHRYRDPFRPLVPNFEFIKYDKTEELKEKINKGTAALILEPIQGEGGLNVPSKEYMEAARDITQDKNTLLVMDEVQSGVGRTGKMFGYEQYEIEPDAISLAKALGNGFPIGAMVAKEEIANEFEPGDHASTFGGNPMASTAALATLNTIEEENLLEKTRNKGIYFEKQLKKLAEEKEWIKEVRGEGLMIGVEVEKKASQIVKEAMKDNVLINNLGDNVLRFVPPLVIGREEIDKVVSTIAKK